MISVIELFAGIGSQTQALKNIDIEHKVVGISEIDKYAIKVYEMLHRKINNFGDIKKIENLPYCDLLTYSFPCQDLSIAGKQQGIKQGTRSGLLFEVERLLNGMTEKPKYLLLENVKNLISKKFYNQYQDWLNKLSSFGYVNYSMLLNAKDYGIPQNRERVFCVSIRKDQDKYFWLPEKQKLKISLRDLLENKVDIKYYISEKVKDNFKFQINLKKQGLVQIGYINSNSKGNRVYNTSMATCLTGNGGGLGAKTGLYSIDNCIRRLTPRECFRLMGFSDEQFIKILGISNTQLYKMAGNSIVVNVLETIFKNLFFGDNK